MTTTLKDRLRGAINAHQRYRQKTKNSRRQLQSLQGKTLPLATPTECNTGNFHISIGSDRYALRTCEAALVFCDNTLENGCKLSSIIASLNIKCIYFLVGRFSQNIGFIGGPTLREHLTNLRNMLKNNKLFPGQTVDTGVFGYTNNSLKRIFHGHISKSNIDTVYDEQELRLCYFNAMVQAARQGYTSLALPLHPLSAMENCHKIPSLVAIQSICIFLKMFPNTRLNRFHLVIENNNAINYLLRKLKNFKQEKPIGKCVKLRRSLESKISTGKLDFKIFEAKCFTNENMLKSVINLAKGDIDRAK